MAASGVRSSWLASAANRRSRASLAARRRGGPGRGGPDLAQACLVGLRQGEVRVADRGAVPVPKDEHGDERILTEPRAAVGDGGHWPHVTAPLVRGIQ